ncbi:MAG: molybdopterin-dependent oxidoreductase [Gammaproteobacteria bacterium]|jgi:xanthine dehydrogenase molybdenum-binding subunit|nr:molybdopterin-dependent oxidoreductase [Gammaproteobacteria bacterium]
MSLIGTSPERPDAFDKVTGGKAFPVNVKVPGMLHAKLLRSPYPHARILRIDTSAAEKLPGVKAVLVPSEVPKRKFTPVYFVPTDAGSMVQDMLIMSDTVRFAGQPVAAVAATSLRIAEQAIELIEVEYEELPTVFDPEEAMQPGAPQLHEHAPNNVAVNPVIGFGDLDKGFAEADYIFEGVYSSHRVHTCYMEPRVCIVDCDRQGNFTVHSSTQHLFGVREKLAYALEIPESKVRVIKAPYIGGGFGGKLDIGYIEPIAALLSRKTGRPVRIEQTRYEDFITTARHPIKVYLKTGVKKDGTFTARHARSILDTGAHATHGAEVINVHGVFGLLMTYRCPNSKWEGYTVYTNNMIGGGYRGYGSPQACFAAESQIDEICEQLKLDPIEFRRKNAWHAGEPHPMVPGVTLDSYAFDECLQSGAERIGWSQRKKADSGSGTKKRGMGFACQPLWVSGCVGFPDIYEHSGAIIKLNVDGTADLAIATMDIGSGQTTTLCQIAAEELGLPMEAVRMVQNSDTTTVPVDAPTHASRATYSAGNAVQAAARTVRERLLKVAGIMLDINPEQLAVANGRVSVKADPKRSLSVAEVVTRAESPFVQHGKNGPAPTTLEEKGTIIGVSSLAPKSNPSPVSVEFVEVEVDTETGQVQVLRVVYAHDLGKLIHRNGAEGQVEGGFQQGMGYALMENLLFDPVSGSCLAGDFLDYKIPTAVEMPRDIQSIFIESNEPSGPFGAKSLSEPCITVPAPAIANAIYNAIGVRIRELPITPEKILAALGKL